MFIRYGTFKSIIDVVNTQNKVLNHNPHEHYPHHCAMKRGYHTKKGITVLPYNGRFGKGYTVEENDPRTTQYHTITYYIERI